MAEIKMLAPYRNTTAIAVGFCIFLLGCSSVPIQVKSIHLKERQIIESLQKAHLALVDSYVDMKLKQLEQFFFKEYAPEFRKYWLNIFDKNYDRPYNAESDFAHLSNDLVAEYEDIITVPIQETRTKLREAISTEYLNALDAHQAVAGWLENAERLGATQQQAMNYLLSKIDPKQSLSLVDEEIVQVESDISDKLKELTE